MSLSLGQFVKVWSYKGERTGRIIAKDVVNGQASYAIKYGPGIGKDTDVVLVSETEVVKVISDKNEIEEITKQVDGVIEITPDQLWYAFSQALGVKNATGWKTGEQIINILWGKG